MAIDASVKLTDPEEIIRSCIRSALNESKKAVDEETFMYGISVALVWYLVHLLPSETVPAARQEEFNECVMELVCDAWEALVKDRKLRPRRKVAKWDLDVLYASLLSGVTTFIEGMPARFCN